MSNICFRISHNNYYYINYLTIYTKTKIDDSKKLKKSTANCSVKYKQPIVIFRHADTHNISRHRQSLCKLPLVWWYEGASFIVETFSDSRLNIHSRRAPKCLFQFRILYFECCSLFPRDVEILTGWWVYQTRVVYTLELLH